jgi:hypothetical protein
MSLEIKKGLSKYLVETYRNIDTNEFYFIIEEYCTCQCGNEHTTEVYNSEEDNSTFNTRATALKAGKNYINENC